MVNVWCCKPIGNIFGAVKKTSYLSLVMLMIYHFVLELSQYPFSTRCCS
jgi:hypothetical protein